MVRLQKHYNVKIWNVLFWRQHWFAAARTFTKGVKRMLHLFFASENCFCTQQVPHTTLFYVVFVIINLKLNDDWNLWIISTTRNSFQLQLVNFIKMLINCVFSCSFNHLMDAAAFLCHMFNGSKTTTLSDDFGYQQFFNSSPFEHFHVMFRISSIVQAVRGRRAFNKWWMKHMERQWSLSKRILKSSTRCGNKE